FTQTFTGQDSLTTPPFNIAGIQWRITWETEAADPRYTIFNMFVYPNRPNALPLETVSYSGNSGSDTVYIRSGGQDYYLKIIAANQKSWKVTVDDYIAKKEVLSTSPVQIVHIKYQGKVYPPDPEKGLCYIRVEPDEYVEIKNISDQPQDIRGWVLTNITKGYLKFTFPPFNPRAEGEYPEPMFLKPYQAVRVYTNEIHDEFGGFSFNYGTGNYWNNKVPDTAVLFNAEGKEMSRKNYTIKPR
ncbi:MAG: lamin tail domain-containing protein, partial [Chloroflexi bacterium]|nr:lamin tail domain-containing protein [Chloroflexota bacterium]